MRVSDDIEPPDHLKPKLRGYYLYGMRPTLLKIKDAMEWMGVSQRVVGHDGEITWVTSTTKWAILKAFGDHPQGNTEIVHTLGIDILNVRPTTTRMQERGLVYWNNGRAPTDRGKTERVYDETLLGHEVIARKLVLEDFKVD